MPLSDEHLREIGRITINFATLDFHLAFAIGSLLTQDQAVAQMVAHELSFKQKLALFSSLVQHKLPASTKATAECATDFENYVSRCAQLEERRNQVAHSVWLEQSTPGGPIQRLKITAKKSKGLRHHTEEIEIGSLKQLADDLRDTAQEVIPLLLRCFEPAPM
jgi:hypothetical protein